MSSTSPDFEDGLTHRAVFLSYAREDTAAAQRIAEALRSQGVEVWFDQSELRGGDVWDQKIRRQIKGCSLFVPIISERTQARGEGYFRLEWKLAVERTHLMAEGVPFLAPVVVDGTSESAAIVPAEFLRVQWVRLPGSLPTPQFVEQVKRMLESPHKAPVQAPPAPSAPAASAPSRKGLWAAAALVTVGLAAAAGFVFSRHSPARPVAAQAEPRAPSVDGKSIAVLPFENMSEDKGNAFFSDGVHEDVLTNLSFIHDLHVVSRTSVMQYRGTTKSIRQIGKELGVAYVLEGSVRREGNKVRVTGQLIDARTDQHVWAKAYDRDLNDIFAIQGELAQAIADALQSVLSPETKVLLARRPTENPVAYDDYLKARQARATITLDAGTKAISLLEDAVRLDPNFAQAWAELASERGLEYFNREQTKDNLRLAKEAIDTAVRIAPNDPAVIEGLGDYYYYGYRDYARATEQYMKLAQMRPNDPATFYSLGLIQRRQGRLDDALPNLRRGLELDPTNGTYIGNYIQALAGVRRFEEAEKLSRKYSSDHPQNMEVAAFVATLAFNARGSTAEMKAFAERAVEPAQRSEHLYFLGVFAGIRGDWEEFKRIDREQRYYDEDASNPRWSQDVNAAENYAESGDMAAARARAADAVALMKAEVVRQPDSSLLWASLGLANALLGEKDEALRSAQRSAELMPESRDAIVGTGNSAISVYTLTWIGEKDRALAEIERLLHVPFGLNLHSSSVSFRPLRDEPRFRQLMADPANNAPLL